jgi:transmembrane sensor
MSIDRPIGLNDQISQEAAQWLVEFRIGDIDSIGRRDFDSWLRASPEHIRAFIEIAALWHEGNAIDPGRQLDLDELVSRARSEQNIAEWTPGHAGGAAASLLSVDDDPSGGGADAIGGGAGTRRGRVARWAVAASLLSALLVTALVLEFHRPGSRTYTTDTGERRSILLPDGSKVLLDSKSRLRVSYTVATRKVELLQGQALFSVLKSPQRPFLVEAGQAAVRDIGTVFDVNRLGDGTVVTVVEGRVAAEERGAAQPIYLSAGEQWDVHIGQFPPQPIHVDTSSETAWTRGEVVLESATLAELAQVFNRYSTRRIVAQDLGKKPLHLSGVFSTNPDFVIGYLRGRPDVVTTETDSEIHLVRDPAR